MPPALTTKPIMGGSWWLKVSSRAPRPWRKGSPTISPGSRACTGTSRAETSKVGSVTPALENGIRSGIARSAAPHENPNLPRHLKPDGRSTIKTTRRRLAPAVRNTTKPTDRRSLSDQPNGIMTTQSNHERHFASPAPGVGLARRVRRISTPRPTSPRFYDCRSIAALIAGQICGRCGSNLTTSSHYHGADRTAEAIFSTFASRATRRKTRKTRSTMPASAGCYSRTR